MLELIDGVMARKTVMMDQMKKTVLSLYVNLNYSKKISSTVFTNFTMHLNCIGISMFSLVYI